jgi:hypothetical protein
MQSLWLLFYKENIVTTKLTMVTKQDVPTLIQISGIWTDVMRMGLEADNNQNDAEWLCVPKTPSVLIL